MLEKIKALEKLALELEPNTSERKYLQEQVIAYSERFLEQIDTLNAYNVTQNKGKGVYDAPINRTGKSIDTLLDLLETEVDFPGLNPASGGHLAYIPGGGIYPAALGDYLADVTNRYAGVFYASPGAVRIENQLIRWLNDCFGFPETAGGNLTSGGSIANLTAIVTARESKQLKAREYEHAVIYTTAQTHHCVHKALKVAGMVEATIRKIATDSDFRMDTAALSKQIQLDRAAHLRPFMVVGSAGTTDTGAVDPLNALADICNDYDLWFHVDAAYGGFFIMAEETKALFNGIERADSIVVDPHKGLFLPYGSGAILVRDVKKIHSAHHMKASYLQDSFDDLEEISPADVSAELSKPFRGLRLWLPLQLFGTAPFEAGLREKIWLCRYFYDAVQTLGFKVGPYPQLSVMLFRYVPKNADANAYNLDLIERVKLDGRVFLSSTTIEGVVYIRLAVLAFRTHLSTIETCLEVLKELVQQENQTHDMGSTTKV